MKAMIRSIRTHSRRRLRQRRGVTIVVVLGLLAITLALSYTIMRSQGTAVLIQQNSSRRGLARQAAAAGMAVALRKMSQADWAGVDTTFTGQMSAQESYTVVYTAGDASLARGDPAYAEQPYRVTIVATGHSSDPTQSAAVSTHRMRAVVGLSPRALAAEPTGWNSMLQHTVYHWRDGDFTVELPSRVEGPIWTQGRIRVADDYPSNGDANESYLTDLKKMAQNGWLDLRPLNGPVSLRTSKQGGSTLAMLNGQLGVSTTAIGDAPVAVRWDPPAQHLTYRLYAGGKQYTAGTVGGTLANVTLRPDPDTNPLGLYYRRAAVTLDDDVTIEGTLITQEDINITGVRVNLSAVLLPALNGGSQPVRLPAAVTGDDFYVQDGASGSVTGIIAVADDFQIKQGHEDIAFSVTGRVFTRDFEIQGRDQWKYNPHLWSLLHGSFESQDNGGHGSIPYFPVYMLFFGRNPLPLLTVRPPSSPVIDHWKEPDQPVYVPHAADTGLRWNVLQWSDYP